MVASAGLPVIGIGKRYMSSIVKTKEAIDAMPNSLEDSEVFYQDGNCYKGEPYEPSEYRTLCDKADLKALSASHTRLLEAAKEVLESRKPAGVRGKNYILLGKWAEL